MTSIPDFIFHKVQFDYKKAIFDHNIDCMKDLLYLAMADINDNEHLDLCCLADKPSAARVTDLIVMRFDPERDIWRGTPLAQFLYAYAKKFYPECLPPDPETNGDLK